MSVSEPARVCTCASVCVCVCAQERQQVKGERDRTRQSRFRLSPFLWVRVVQRGIAAVSSIFCLTLHLHRCPLFFLLLLSEALFFSFSAWHLVVGKNGPDNSALVSMTLLSSSPSLVAFGELWALSFIMKM